MIQDYFKTKTVFTLGLIFLIAVLLRFLYFPDNIYFGYDQARDAFQSLGILNGEFKIVGPTTSIPGLNHGALFYYLYAVIYFISQSDPAGLATFLRIYNALGVVLIFFIAQNLFGSKNPTFGKWVGIISALLFAFSYEQTQYALFMTHPALAVLSVLTFYLGMSLLFFRKNPYGFVVSLLGLGLSFQFHFLLAYLGIIFVISLGIFWRSIPRLNWKVILGGVLAFGVSVSTFIVAELKFGFTTVKNLTAILTGSQSSGAAIGGINNALLAGKRYVYDNLLAVNGTEPFLLLVLFIAAVYFLRDKEYRNQIIFLLVWFIGGLVSYFINDTSLYFYGVGTSISLLLLAAFLIMKIFPKYKYVSAVLIVIILGSNIYMIQKNNPRGPNKEINVQTGMLLGDQKKAIDYIYTKAGGDPFAVNAFSMPLNINTTWAYLLEWYGKEKYGYLPVWGGNNAKGYEGNLEINNSRSTLPYKRFLIMEPIRGVEIAVKDFFINESWFTDIIEERHFGDIIVDFQKPK